MMLRRLFGNPLEVDAIVGGGEGIRPVQEVDLELARAKLGCGGVRRQALRLRPGAHRLQVTVQRIDRTHVVELKAVRLPAECKAFRRARPSGLAPVVLHHIEFQLGGHHWCESAFLISLKQGGKDGARVHEARAAIELVHRGENLQRSVRRPRHGREAAAVRNADAIGVADRQGQPGDVVIVVTPDVERLRR